MIKSFILIGLLFSFDSLAFDAELQSITDNMDKRQETENNKDFNDSTGWESRRNEKINNEYNQGNNFYNLGSSSKYSLRECMGLRFITNAILKCERI
jgi:hypothetical protein